MANQAHKYLTFTLDDECYGIPILKVREIIGIMPITHVPKMPSFMKGVINLRGRIIPITDLRIKFGLEAMEFHDRTCIIVVEMDTDAGKSVNGVVVDSVSDVLDIGDENIEPPPACYGNSEEQSFLTSIGKVKDKVVMLIDADKILTTMEIKVINRLDT